MIHSQSADKIKDDHTKTTFRYSKIHETFNLNDMYESLNPKVTQLVKQNRAKFTSMNSVKSKDLINKTHSKLIAFLRSQPVRKTYSNSTSKTERPNNKIFNIYRRQDEEKQNFSQQIFDFTKLQQIMQAYQQNSQIKPKQSVRFNGALTQKVFRLFKNNKRQISTVRPFTQRTQSKANLQPSSTIGDYMSWKTQKLKRRMKKPFN